jgi:hypothetical protein
VLATSTWWPDSSSSIFHEAAVQTQEQSQGFGSIRVVFNKQNSQRGTHRCPGSWGCSCEGNVVLTASQAGGPSRAGGNLEYISRWPRELSRPSAL